MRADLELEDDALLMQQIEKLSETVEKQHASLQHEQTRSKVATQILRALHAVVRGVEKRTVDTRASCQLLSATKVVMRDRRGIQDLLTLEALHLFVTLAEFPDVAVGEEALKCVINSVYSRPEFVRDFALPHGYKHRILKLSARAGPASFHFMVWKTLLVSCEAPEMILALVSDIQVWKHIHATLHFVVCGGGSALGFPSGLDRVNLSLELVKFIAVLVNDLKSSVVNSRLDGSGLMAMLQPLGKLLLEIIQYSPTHVSPLSGEVIDLKNKVVETFMFIPFELLGFFIQQQHEALSSILSHLYTMLVLIRIEKTRATKDLLPVLVACHHLTSTADPVIRGFFRAHVFTDSGEGDRGVPAHHSPASPAFFHKHLVFFLTSLDTTVKRYMGEWLYLLCDQNADEYTRRTGLGNAIGLLRIKGLA